MPQFFKGDTEELKFYNAGAPALAVITEERSEFYEGAFETFTLGEVIYDLALSPLVNAIPRNVFRTTFFSLFNSFQYAGTFESYLSVFRNVFGSTVDVTFTVPGPGQLNIDIVANGMELYDFIARGLVGTTMVTDNVVTQDGDQIVFQIIKGLNNQYEAETMLFEMVPGGIFTTITLNIEA